LFNLRMPRGEIILQFEGEQGYTSMVKHLDSCYYFYIVKNRMRKVKMESRFYKIHFS